MSRGKASVRSKVKVPNGALYLIVYLLIYPFLKIFVRLKVDRTGYVRPDGPFVVLSNHQSFMDFVVVMLSIYPRRLNAVAAQKFFFYKPLNKLLPLMGAIPKNLFEQDARSIQRIFSVIRRGGAILLFPEGRCTVDGSYMGMNKTTGKLVQRLGVPVVSCRIDGSYICMPFWRKGIRSGRVRVTLKNMLSPQDAGGMSVDEINSLIDVRLSGEGLPAPKKPFAVRKAKGLAEGLENILYYCPCCESEFTLKTRGNEIYCTACGRSAVMDRAAKLNSDGDELPDGVHAWYKAQSIYEARLLHEDMDPIETAVTVRMPTLRPGEGVGLCGRGTLWLEPEGWHYEGSLYGETVRLFFPVGSVPALPFDPKDDFQIYAGGNFYMFTPENPQACSKYAAIGECAHWRFAANVQMTPGFDSGFVAREAWVGASFK